MRKKAKQLAAKLAIENGPFSPSAPFRHWYRQALRILTGKQVGQKE